MQQESILKAYVKLFMYGEYRDVTFHIFPAGEIGCQLSDDVLSVLWQWGKKSSCTIEVLFQGSDDMLKVMCLADALREFQPAVKLNLSIPKENFTETLFDMAGEKQKKDVAHRVVASLVEAGGFSGLFENSGGGCVTKESVDNILKELQSGQFLYD